MKIKNMKLYLAGLMLGTTMYTLSPLATMSVFAEEVTAEDPKLNAADDTVIDNTVENDDSFGDFIPEDTPTEAERKGITPEPTPEVTPEPKHEEPTHEEPKEEVYEVPAVVYVPKEAPVVYEAPKTGEDYSKMIASLAALGSLGLGTYAIISENKTKGKRK